MRRPDILGNTSVVDHSSHIDILETVFRWNNWTGLQLYDDQDVTIQQTRADHNGFGGISGYKVEHLKVLSSEASSNGWRAARGVTQANSTQFIDNNLLDFAAGQKFFHLRDALFQDFRSVHNQTAGLWFDYDNARVRIVRVRLIDNRTQGLHVEASQGPQSVVDSSICGNETGVLINNASRVSIEGSVIANNAMGQFWQVGTEEPRVVWNAYTSQKMSIESDNWTFSGNTIRSTSQQRGIGTYMILGWRRFVSTLSSDNNRWAYWASPKVFQVANGVRLALAGWTRPPARTATLLVAASSCRTARPESLTNGAASAGSYRPLGESPNDRPPLGRRGDVPE